MEIFDWFSIPWIKSLHIIAMVAWFAGLFYLPRIFVYHAPLSFGAVHDQFCIMERKLYRFIMRPAMILTVAAGSILAGQEWSMLHDSLWFYIKITSVTLLLVYHFYCGHIVKQFATGTNLRPHTFYRLFNEIPTLILVAIVIMVVVRPF